MGSAGSKALDEGVRISVAKWASIAALLAAAVFWFHRAPFEVVVRFLLTVGAMVVLFQALRARYCAVSPAFGALPVFYSPVVPVFSFSSDWQRTVVAISAVPLVLSLPGRDKRTKNND